MKEVFVFYISAQRMYDFRGIDQYKINYFKISGII